MLPELYAKYPNKLVQLVISASAGPTAMFTPAGITGVGNGTILFNVINDDKTLSPAFILGVNAMASIGDIGAKPWYDIFFVIHNIVGLLLVWTLQER